MNEFSNNKALLRHCPNFYKIINYEYYEDDLISKKIVSVYRDYIFSSNVKNRNNMNKLEQLDIIVNKYIDDYFFRKELVSEMKIIRIRKEENILESIVNWIIKVFDNYEAGYTRNIYFSRWI